jgi:hypothetical protein
MYPNGYNGLDIGRHLKLRCRLDRDAFADVSNEVRVECRYLIESKVGGLRGMLPGQCCRRSELDCATGV